MDVTKEQGSSQTNVKMRIFIIALSKHVISLIFF